MKTLPIQGSEDIDLIEVLCQEFPVIDDYLRALPEEEIIRFSVQWLSRIPLYRYKLIKLMEAWRLA